jgi:hypothetical protein
VPKKVRIQCPVCGKWVVTVSKTCSIKCARVAFPQPNRNDDPSEDEIREACAEIRSRWSPEETARRWVGPRLPDSPIKTISAPVTRRGGLTHE